MATVLQVAINDGNYYEMINGGQDIFVLPRLFGLDRPVDPIPPWHAAGLGNWPGIVAVLAAVLFGAWGLQLFPGQISAPSLGLVPVESWLIAGVLYLLLASAVARTGSARSVLGFGRHLVAGTAASGRARWPRSVPWAPRRR